MTVKIAEDFATLQHLANGRVDLADAELLPEMRRISTTAVPA